MRIIQVTLQGASLYERKSQRIDRAALEARGHEVVVLEAVDRAVAADVVHLYGPIPLPRPSVRGLGIPYVSNGPLARARWPLFDRAPEPAAIAAPLPGDGRAVIPEAVEDEWFAAAARQASGSVPKVLGSCAAGRPWVRNLAEQTMMRVHRFRDDVEWHLFDEPPRAADLSRVDAWVDPARDDADLDGFVAEALVAGCPVAATRTAINELRTDRGRTAMLVPPGDPNELTHAILALLFKPEVALQKVQAGRLTASKFRPGPRLRALMQLYETLTR